MKPSSFTTGPTSAHPSRSSGSSPRAIKRPLGPRVKQSAMADIVVIGSLNADLVVRAARFPKPGETIQGDDLATIPGGKGANQAVAAARLGASVAMVGCVGADAFGSTLIENLKQNNVDVRHVLRDGSAATGTAIIIVDSNGQNSIVLSPGANARVTGSDIDAAVFT